MRLTAINVCVFLAAAVLSLSLVSSTWAADGAIVFPVITGYPDTQFFYPHPGWIDMFPGGPSTGVGAAVVSGGTFTLPDPSEPVPLIAGFERMETAPLILPSWNPSPGGLTGWDFPAAEHYDYVCIPRGYPSSWDPDYMVRAHEFWQTFIANSRWLYSVTVFDGPQIIWWGNKVFVSIHQGGVDGPVIAMRFHDTTTNIQTAQHTDYEFPRVGFRHGDIELQPGMKYAVQVTGYKTHGGTGYDLDAFIRPDAGDGYGPGRAYADRVPHEGDLCMFVMGNATGQIVENQIRSEEWEILIPKRPPVTRWGQTFVAHGLSMAGVQLWASNGSANPVSCTVGIRENGPGGSPVGPVKTAAGRAISERPIIRYPDIPGELPGYETYYDPPYDQFSAAWVPDEAPLVPGRTYYVDLQFSEPVMAFVDGDYYHDGYGYYSGQQITSDNLFHSPRWTMAMSIVTYENPGGAPTVYESPTPTPLPGGNLLVNPGAETGNFSGWTVGGDPVIDPSSHIPDPPNHSGNHRFGLSVGWGTADFYQYQSVSVLPGAEYGVSLWISKMDGTHETLTVSWIDGNFGGTENLLYYLADSETYYPEWHELSGASFHPATDRVTLIMRYRHTLGSNIASIHVDDIDLRLLSQQPTPTPPATDGPLLLLR